MTLNEIITNANSLADEQIPSSQVNQWVHDAFSKFNIWWPAMVPFPSLVPEDADKDITITTVFANFVDNGNGVDNVTGKTEEEHKQIQETFRTVNETLLSRIIYPYVTYQIKVNDGSEFEYLDRIREWKEDLLQAKSSYGKFIDPRYLPSDLINGILPSSSTPSANVALADQDSFTYGPANSWGTDPGTGVTIGSGSVSSKNKFGKE